jgi:LPS sulfotransferase NodH
MSKATVNLTTPSGDLLVQKANNWFSNSAMIASRNFVILTHARTGSNLLTLSLLNMGIHMGGEIFHTEEDSRADAMVWGDTPYVSGTDGAEFVRNMYSAYGPVGFKLFFQHAKTGPAATVWDYLISSKDIAIIHLVRRDLFASWVSLKCAERTGLWIRKRAEENRPEVEPFEASAKELEGYFERIHKARNSARTMFAGHPFLEITYEDDLCSNFEGTLNRIADFIGMTELDEPRPATERIEVGDPARAIANFEELAQHFKGSPYSEYFWNRRQFQKREDHPGFCSKPFDTLTIDARGRLRVCCDDWLDTSIGDVRNGGLLEQWNSPTAQALRASILDGSYRYCNKQQCPDLVKKSLPKIEDVTNSRHHAWIESNACVIKEAPSHISLGYDQTCNLKCPTCRDDFIVLKDVAFERAEKIHDRVVKELIPHAKTALITGEGDAFSSRLFRRFLQELDAAETPDLKIYLMTNGLAFTPQMWESMSKAHQVISGVSISVDAATPETYALNRGGNFDKLKRNLKFLGTLIEQSELNFLEISFVVQANNYREMPEFVALAKEIGCRSVLFMKLIFWNGTYPRTQWQDRAVHLPAHPEHQAFLDMLSHPLVQDPIVDLSNLSDLVTQPPAQRAVT